MDKKNIPYGGGYSRIEFCDLFSKSKQMIHVKRYGGSSVLSHLFNQGLVSGECTPQDTVLSAAKPMQGHVSLEDSLSRVQEIFDHDNIAVVIDHDDIVGVISKIDIVEFLAART